MPDSDTGYPYHPHAHRTAGHSLGLTFPAPVRRGLGLRVADLSHAARVAGPVSGKGQTMATVLIPDYDPYDPQPYPGGIKPGEQDVTALLRQHADDPQATRFIADMLEE